MLLTTTRCFAWLRLVLANCCAVGLVLGLSVTAHSAPAGQTVNRTQCKVIVAALNFRTGPGLHYAPPITTLPRDSALIPLSRNLDSTWIKVRTVKASAVGWVSALPRYVACDSAVRDLPLDSDIYGPYPDCEAAEPACNRPDVATMPPEFVLDTPILVEEMNTVLPGERPVIILVGFAPQELVVKSTTPWGYTDADGQFIAAGIGILGHAGGVITGVIPGHAGAEKVVAKVAVDYVNPALQDDELVIEIPVEVFGAHAIVDLTSGVVSNRILLRVEGTVTTDDYLVFAWSVSTESGTQRQGGAEWFLWPTLVRAKNAVVVRELAVPHMKTMPAMNQERDNAVLWTLSGVIAGTEVMESGTLVIEQDAMLIRLDAHQTVWVDGVQLAAVDQE